MNKDLTWKLKTPPTDLGLAKLVEQGVYTADEARDLIENFGIRRPASKLTTVVHVLMDASGSMESVRDATIDGYNEYVNALKKDGGKYKLSLTTFDSGNMGELRLKNVHQNVYVDDVPKLSRKTFVPMGGTPLYDAFCTVLKAVKSRDDEKHLFVVLTDGGENASREFTANDMKELKSTKEKSGNWTFVYLGANQDSWAVAQQFGYTIANVSDFNATGTGVNVNFLNLARSTTMYSASASMSTSGFYTDEQKKQNKQSV